MTPATPPVRFGIDRILGDPRGPFRLLGLDRRPTGVGLVTSDGAPPGMAGVGSTRQGLLDAGVPLKALFTPEHGLSGTAPDGAGLEDALDPKTGLPVFSLYGARLTPPPEELAKLDLVLFDLQSVGVRFYTFLWTLLYLMEACQEAQVPLRILDRPNPLGGKRESVEGPILDTASAASFLGRWAIPIRHSLTMGEMALLLKDELELKLDLGIVTMEGWNRAMLWPDTGLPFSPPSPGIPSFSSALLYPGLALLEATNVHQGRGTQLAFQWFGAPWMDPMAAAEALNARGLPGVRATPRPLLLPSEGSVGGEGSSPREDRPCPGVYLQLTNPPELRPVHLGLHLLSTLAASPSGEFGWSPYPTAVNPSGEEHLTKLLGSRGLAMQIQGGEEDLGARGKGPWTPRQEDTQAPGWWERAEAHLLYE